MPAQEALLPLYNPWNGVFSRTGSLARTGWMGRQHMLSKIRHLRHMVLEHRLEELVGEVPSFGNAARIPGAKHSRVQVVN